MIYTYPLIALNREGETRLFYDAETFCAFAHDRSNGRVGGYWLEYYSGWGERTRLVPAAAAEVYTYQRPDINDWIVRDDRGRVVDIRDFPRPRYRPYWAYGRYRDQRVAAERGLPIPGSGHRRGRSRKKWTKNGRNGAHNQRKGVKLYEDPRIANHEFDDL